MSKIGFRLKSSINKAVSIYVNFRPTNSGTIETRTGLSINPALWSKQKQRAKSRDGSLQDLNYTLNDLSTFLEIRINNAIFFFSKPKFWACASNSSSAALHGRKERLVDFG